MKHALNCIMMIDDDEPTNFISNILFEEANCTQHLEIFNSGQKALDYFKNIGMHDDGKGRFKVPDLIFLDMNMPCMNGWEFLDEYTKLKKKNHLKPVIIMLTTSLDPDDRQRAESNPEITSFENKPLTLDMIGQVMEKYFTSFAPVAQKSNREETIWFNK